jgi:hypothetical protein
VPNPLTPAERFATLLLWLYRAVDTRSAWGLPLPVIALIIGRLRGIKQCFARLAARVSAGKYLSRRRAAPPCPQPGRTARRADPLPKNFGWLLKLVPEAVGYRAQLEHLFRDAEMAALLAAAPAPMRRPLRSLCHMLGLRPPPILAPVPASPERPRPKRVAPAAAPEKPPRPQPPPWLSWPRRTRWSLARICGSPDPA